MCLEESYLPDVWKASSVVSVFKNVGEIPRLKNTALLDFSDIQYEFRSSHSTTDFLKVLLDRVSRALTRYEATRAAIFETYLKLHTNTYYILKIHICMFMYMHICEIVTKRKG